MAESTDGAVIDFIGRSEAETTAWAIVEPSGDLGTMPLGEVLEVRALRQILAQKPVGVFIGAAFPRVVRGSEEEAGAELALDVLVAMEFGAVVGSDGVDGMRFVAQDLDGAPSGIMCARASQLADAHQSALAFDRGHRSEE